MRYTFLLGILAVALTGCVKILFCYNAPESVKVLLRDRKERAALVQELSVVAENVDDRKVRFTKRDDILKLNQFPTVRQLAQHSLFMVSGPGYASLSVLGGTIPGQPYVIAYCTSKVEAIRFLKESNDYQKSKYLEDVVVLYNDGELLIFTTRH